MGSFEGTLDRLTERPIEPGEVWIDRATMHRVLVVSADKRWVVYDDLVDLEQYHVPLGWFRENHVYFYFPAALA